MNTPNNSISTSPKRPLPPTLLPTRMPGLSPETLRRIAFAAAREVLG